MNPEQIAFRQTGLGATDVVAIVGLSEYGTPFSVYAEKKGFEQSREVSDVMRFGKRIERVVAEMYADRYHRTIEWLDTTFRHPDPKKSYALATPDFRHSDAAKHGGEGKYSTYRDPERWGEDSSDKVPEAYFVQAQWQMHVMEWDLVMMPVWFVRELVTYVIPRNDAIIEQLDARAEEFWQEHILADTPPELDWSEAAKAWVERSWPKAGLETLEATREQEQLMKRYQVIGAQLKSLDREKVGLSMQLRAEIGAARGIAGAGLRAICFDVKGHERVQVVKPHRQLRVYGAAEGEEED